MARKDATYIEELLLGSGQHASGDSGVMDGFADFDALALYVLVESALGSHSTSFGVEDTVDGVNFATVGPGGSVSYSPNTVNALTVIRPPTISAHYPFADRIRVKWTVNGGTPTFKLWLMAKRTGH